MATYDLQFQQRLDNPEFYERTERQILRDVVFSLQALASPRLRYIDRSHHNGEDDFDQLAAGGDVVIYSHKLTQGTSYPSASIQLGQDRLKKAFDAGLLIQGYHFYEDKNGKDEAFFFLEAFEPVAQYTDGVYLPHLLDVEINFGLARSLRQSRVGNLLWWWGAETQKKPMWYSSAYLFNTLLGSDTPWKNEYWKHIASWTTASSPTMPSGVTMDKLFGWQYGVCGQHSWAECPVGVVGATDVNYLMIPLEEAKLLAGVSGGPDPIPGDLEERVIDLEVKAAAFETQINNLKTVDSGLLQGFANLSTKISALTSGQINLRNRVAEIERIHEEIGDLLQ